MYALYTEIVLVLTSSNIHSLLCDVFHEFSAERRRLLSKYTTFPAWVNKFSSKENGVLQVLYILVWN